MKYQSYIDKKSFILCIFFFLALNYTIGQSFFKEYTQNTSLTITQIEGTSSGFELETGLGYGIAASFSDDIFLTNASGDLQTTNTFPNLNDPPYFRLSNGDYLKAHSNQGSSEVELTVLNGDGNIINDFMLSSPGAVPSNLIKITGEFSNGDVLLSVPYEIPGTNDTDVRINRVNVYTGQTIWQTDAQLNFQFTFSSAGAFAISENDEAFVQYNNSSAGSYRLLKISSSGQILWDVQSGSTSKFPIDLSPSSDGGVWYIYNQVINSVEKRDESGNVVASALTDPIFMAATSRHKVVATNDGGVVCAGMVGDDMFTLKLGAEGEVLNINTLDNLPSPITRTDAGLLLPSGEIVFGGSIDPSGAIGDNFPFLLKVNENGEFALSSSCNESIPGFTFLGDFEDAKYFLSDASFQWEVASGIASDNGGYIAAINNAAENTFILNNINEIVFIGLTDAASEGSLIWDSGEGVTFNNLDEANTTNNDFGVINFWNGNWGLVNQFVQKRFIMEVPCGGDPPEPGITINNCPQSFSVEALAINGYSAFVDWSVPTATTDCAAGGLTITQIVGPAPGGNYGVNIPDETIVYEVSDACGNVGNCVFFVNVFPEADEIICPDNITVTATSADGAQVFFDDPEIITYCNPGDEFTIVQGLPSGSVFPIGTTEVRFNNFLSGTPSYCQNFINCLFTVTVLPEGGGGDCPDDITGYSTLGEYGDSKYFLSDEGMTWEDASQAASTNGGYLASINSQEENDFLAANINSIVFIGLNDAASEGSLSWDSGEDLTYNNLSGGNAGDNDYGVMNFWDGSWNLINQYVSKRYILEVPCDEGPPSGDLPDLTATNISGLATSGEVGSVVNFQFTLSNIGAVTASNNYYVNSYLSTDNTFSNDDILIGEVFTGFTPIGSTLVDGAITVPDQPEGDYYLIVVADALGQIGEENENNNSSSTTFTIDSSNGDPFCAFEEVYPVNSSLGYKRFEVAETSTGLMLEAVSYNGFGIFNTTDFEYTAIGSNGVANSTTLTTLPTSVRSEQGDYSYQSETVSPTEFNVSKVDENGNPQWTTTVIVQANDPDIDVLTQYDIKEIDGHIVGFGVYHYGTSATWKSFAYKLNIDGDLIWENTYDTESYFLGTSIYGGASDGGTYIRYENINARTIALRKLSSNGDVDWTTSMAGDLVSNRVIFGGEPADGSGVFFGVWAFSSARGDVTKLTTQTGEEIWNTYLPNEFRDDPSDFAVNIRGFGFVPTDDGGIVAEVSFFSPSPSDVFQKYGRLDSNGAKVWSFDMPDDLSDYDPVLALNDGGFIFGAYLEDSKEIGLFYIDGNGSFLPSCENDPIEDCPGSIDGFTTLGEFGNSKYFLSETGLTWEEASQASAANGGYLASITSQDENDFLAANINSIVFIGLNDMTSEGSLEWDSGETPTYNNLASGNSDENDYGVMNFWDGSWGMVNHFVVKPFILEIPCNSANENNVQGRQFSQDDKDLVVVEVYPNPAVDRINIAIVSPFSKTINYQIYDANGRGVYSDQAEILIGENVLSIDVTNLPGGLYHLYFPDAHARKSNFRFMRIH